MSRAAGRETDRHEDQRELLEPALESLSLNPMCTRRQTLKWGGASIIGISVLGPVLARGATKPLIIMDRAQGIVVSDPVTCTGCGRCELACTEFNDGKANPLLSRIKVGRNLAFGPEGLSGFREGKGNWGDGLVIQDLCKQCPHPVPCADICPENAIVVAPKSNARMVDLEKCTGCKICLKACPWEMISFDPESRKVTKCDLCGGKPKCVEACPAGSLSYVPWRDLTGKVPPRNLNTAKPSSERVLACNDCHLPGQPKNVEQGMEMLAGSVKGGRPLPARHFGFRWIDLAGSFLVPVALISVGVHAIVRAVKR